MKFLVERKKRRRRRRRIMVVKINNKRYIVIEKRAAISAKRSNCYYGQTGGRTKKFASVKLLNPGWLFTFKSSN